MYVYTARTNWFPRTYKTSREIILATTGLPGTPGRARTFVKFSGDQCLRNFLY